MTPGTPSPAWRTNRRRIMAVGAGAAGAGNAVLLAACGAPAPAASPGGGAPKPSTQPVTVRMNVRSGGDEELWKFFAPKLKEKLPNVTYQVEGTPGDFSTFLQKVTVLAASNQLGDVIYSTTTSGLFDVLIVGKLLRPIDDLVKADKYDLRVFYKPGIDLLTRSGKLYGVPNTCQPGSVVLYYNTRLLQQQGAPLPSPDWTPEDAVAAARRVTAPSDTWGYVPDLAPQGIPAMIQAFGGTWLTKDGRKAALNTPATRQALVYLADLMYRDKVAPPPGAIQGGALTGFLNGKVGMYIGSTSDATRLLNQTDVQVGTSLIPRVRKDLPRGIMRVDGYSVTANTTVPYEAWESIKYVTGPEGSILRADVPGGSGTLGCTVAAWTDPQILSKRGTMQQMYVRALGEAEVNIMAGNYRNDEYQQVMAQKLDPVWKGESQVNDALMQDLQQAVQVVLDKPIIGS